MGGLVSVIGRVSRGVALASLAVALAGCGGSKPAASPSPRSDHAITTVGAATSALQAKLPGWTVAVVALSDGSFEAAAYDTTGRINQWAYRNQWLMTGQARYPHGADGFVVGPAQHLFPNAAPTGLTGGLVKGMRHGTFVLAMSGWSDSVVQVGGTDLVYTTTDSGTFSTVSYHEDASGMATLEPGIVDPQNLVSIAVEPSGTSVVDGVLRTPGSTVTTWSWSGGAFRGEVPRTPQTPTTPAMGEAPCRDWGLPQGAVVVEVNYCRDGWAVLGYTDPHAPTQMAFRAHWVKGAWQRADDLCMNPTAAVPKSWLAACQVG